MNRVTSRFRSVHNKLQPSVFWQIAYKRPKSRRVCQFMTKVMTQKIIGERCLNCGRDTGDLLLHVILECSHVLPEHLRQTFWYGIQTNFDADVFNRLLQLSKEDLLTLMLGGQEFLNVFTTESNYTDFMLLSSKFIAQLST